MRDFYRPSSMGKRRNNKREDKDALERAEDLGKDPL